VCCQAAAPPIFIRGLRVPNLTHTFFR
jgi:hypothetical protein